MFGSVIIADFRIIHNTSISSMPEVWSGDCYSLLTNLYLLCFIPYLKGNSSLDEH